MEATSIIAYVLFGVVFLIIWGVLSHDLNGQNALEAKLGFKPRSQVRPFVFTLCYAIALIAFLYVIHS